MTESRRQSKVAPSTLDAMMYALRKGLPVLEQPWLRSRLEWCDRAAVEDLVKQLRESRGHPHGHLWSEEDIGKLVKTWEGLQNVEVHQRGARRAAAPP